MIRPSLILISVFLAILIFAYSRNFWAIDQTPVARPEVTSQLRPIRVMATGDILLADGAQVFLDKYGYDLLLCNLEGLIADHTVSIASSKDVVYKSHVKAAAPCPGLIMLNWMPRFPLM